MKDLVKGCCDKITLGKFSKVGSLKEQYLVIYENYKKSHDISVEKVKLVADRIDQIIEVQIKLMQISERIMKINHPDNSLMGAVCARKENLEKAINILTEKDSLTDGVTGFFLGTTSAVTAWTLVSSFGTASTGTAISSLSGTAAVNATLSALGGGALYAGGGGMALGAVTLGGIAAAPALFIINRGLSKKIECYEDEIKKIEAERKKMEIFIKILINLEHRTERLLDNISTDLKKAETDYNKLKQNFLSDFIKNLFNKNKNLPEYIKNIDFYTEEINNLISSVSGF